MLLSSAIKSEKTYVSFGSQAPRIPFQDGNKIAVELLFLHHNSRCTFLRIPIDSNKKVRLYKLEQL